jgi:hypothetical protein
LRARGEQVKVQLNNDIQIFKFIFTGCSYLLGTRNREYDLNQSRRNLSDRFSDCEA